MYSLSSGFEVVDTPMRGLADMSEAAIALARRFGPLLPGRFGRVVEEVVPTTAGEAPPRSLSEKYGTDMLPLHMDTAHRLSPARVIVLGCVNVGLSPTSTTLLNVSSLVWSHREMKLLTTAVFLVRTGRSSFYSSIISERQQFSRFDPGCMEPTDEKSEAALRLFNDKISSAPCKNIEWLEGRFLIVDNWRMFHGRTAASANSRRLLVRSCAR
jgi:alpha-ketoglutarate-dependent taurine dioxygenase